MLDSTLGQYARLLRRGLVAMFYKDGESDHRYHGIALEMSEGEA
jgi:hypothetical protein